MLPKGLGGSLAFARTLPAPWVQCTSCTFDIVESMGFADAAPLDRFLFTLPEPVLSQPSSKHEVYGKEEMLLA